MQSREAEERRGETAILVLFTDTKLQKKLYTANEFASCHGSQIRAILIFS